MRECIIAFCTPDLNRPMARRAIECLKATDLRRAELMILDNAYAERFHHAAVMDEMLTYAGSRPVIFMDDDALVREPRWIDRLFQAAEASHAAIVGCAHRSPAGERNHTGILVYAEGSTELTRDGDAGGQRHLYAPAVSSALMLVMNGRGLRFDRQYEKYHHDTDIGLAAWHAGETVACALDLEIEHAQADYASRVTNVQDVLARDLERLQRKWRAFVGTELYRRPELAACAARAAGTNWDLVYGEASRLKATDTTGAARQFRAVIACCPHAWHRAGAYYHLYTLERDPAHLTACLAENPQHQKAAALLRELELFAAR